MRLLICLLTLVPAFASAGICQSKSDLQKKYEAQKDWQEVSIEEPGIPGSISGFVDRQNNLYLNSLTRKVGVNAKVEVDKNNADYKNFYKLCRRSSKFKRELLASFRESQHNNSYGISLRYLPDLSDFKNNPYQQLNADSVKVTVQYGSKAILRSVFDAEVVQQEILQELTSQLKQQGEIGVYNFDLTNYDDLACDLIRGDAKISVYSRAHSKAPVVEKEERVHLKEVSRLYGNWLSQISPEKSIDQRLFSAGAVLEQSRQQWNLQLDDETGLEVLKKVTDPANGQLMSLGSKEIKCVTASMQKYSQALDKHLINVLFKVDKETHLYPEGQ